MPIALSFAGSWGRASLWAGALLLLAWLPALLAIDHWPAAMAPFAPHDALPAQVNFQAAHHAADHAHTGGMDSHEAPDDLHAGHGHGSAGGVNGPLAPAPLPGTAHPASLFLIAWTPAGTAPPALSWAPPPPPPR